MRLPFGRPKVFVNRQATVNVRAGYDRARRGK
jgi:hypothetical protein